MILSHAVKVTQVQLVMKELLCGLLFSHYKRVLSNVLPLFQNLLVFFLEIALASQS